jgi:hypothetical protein
VTFFKFYKVKINSRDPGNSREIEFALTLLANQIIRFKKISRPSNDGLRHARAQTCFGQENVKKKSRVSNEGALQKVKGQGQRTKADGFLGKNVTLRPFWAEYVDGLAETSGKAADTKF